MGTTLTCLLMLDKKFVWGSIGDSRIYWYRDSTIRQITNDHTQLKEYMDTIGNNPSGKIIENYSNYLTRSIDGGKDEPDIFPDVIPYETIKDGDAFLLCSDGLIIDKSTENSNQFKDYIIGTSSLKEAAENIVSSVYNNGSTDNITVILCSFGRLIRKKINLKKFIYPPEEEIKKKNYAEQNRFIIWISLAIIVLVIIVWYIT